MVEYLMPGHQVGHEDWNALYAEANAKMAAAYSHLPVVLWGEADAGNGFPEFLYRKRFYFFNGPVPTAPYRSIAERYFGELFTAPGSPWVRRYDHLPFQAYANGAVNYPMGPRPLGVQVTDLADPNYDQRKVVDDEYGVCRLRALDLESTEGKAWVFGDWQGQIDQNGQPLAYGIWPGRTDEADGPGLYTSNLLLYSLEAHRRQIATPDPQHPDDRSKDAKKYYFIWEDQGTTEDDAAAEHMRMWEPVEIIFGPGIGEAFSWPAHYNKYQFLRFSNLQTVPVTITFANGDPDGDSRSSSLPSERVEVGAMRSVCVRRTRSNAAKDFPASLYTAGVASGWDYFFLHLPGDPWFLARHLNSNVTDPLTIGSQIPALNFGTARYAIESWTNPSPPYGTVSFISRGGRPAVLDCRKFWDMAPMYANLAYRAGTKYERTPPAGGYFSPAEQETTTCIGDILFHKGKILVVATVTDEFGKHESPFLLKRTQEFTVDGPGGQPSAEHRLDMWPPVLSDGQQAFGPAQGVRDLSVWTVPSDDSAPAQVDAGPEDAPNWKVVIHKDGQGNPIEWDVVFFVREGGVLKVGDKVEARFKYVNLETKWWINFNGMASFAESLDQVGVILTQPWPENGPWAADEKGWKLSLDPSMKRSASETRDLIGFSTNIFKALTGSWAVTLGGDLAVGQNAEVEFRGAAQFSAMRQLTCRRTANSVQYLPWHWDADGHVPVADDEETVEWDDSSYGKQDVAVGAISHFDNLKALLDVLREVGGELATAVVMRLTPFGPLFLCDQVLAHCQYAGDFDDDFKVEVVPSLNPEAEEPTVRIARRVSMQIEVETKGAETTGWAHDDWWWDLVSMGTSNNDTVVRVGSNGWMRLVGTGGMQVTFPRLDRPWVDFRGWAFKVDDVMNLASAAWHDQGQLTSEEPMIQSHYESKPVMERVLRLVPVFRKTDVAFLGVLGYDQRRYDVFTRGSAWAHYEKLMVGGQLMDFSRGTVGQNSFWLWNRQRMLTNDPSSDDNLGLNVLPIEVEHFNGAASVVNGAVGSRIGEYQPKLLERLLTGLLANPTMLLNGGIRPRTQWIAWDERVNTEATAGFERLECTVSDCDDLPESFKTLWGFTRDSGNEPEADARWFRGFEILPTTGEIAWSAGQWDGTLNPDGTQHLVFMSVLEAWGVYYLGSQDRTFINEQVRNYRWITIEEAKALHARLGVPFVFEDLSVPARLVIQDASPQQINLDQDPGLVGMDLGNDGTAAVFVNDDQGDWVYNPDATVSIESQIYHVIREDVSPTDFSSILVQMLDGNLMPAGVALWDLGFGDGVGSRLYEDQNVMPAMQAVRANKAYLYRRYEGSPATAVCWSRNYADYARNATNTAKAEHARRALGWGKWGLIERTLREIEGEVEVKELGQDENVIRTGLENAVMRVFLGVRELR